MNPILESYTPLVDAELRRVLSARGDLPLYGMMEHHLGWRGGEEAPPAPNPRRLGAVCLASCEAVGGDIRLALPLAAAIELALNFCEIHDDIQNGSIARNGRDSVWWRWGPAQAINAGDGMHALARMALLGMLDSGFDSATVFEAVRLLDRASLEACEGRFVDLEAQERLDMTSEAYLRMAAAKSGALFACAAEFGALAAGCDGSVRSRFADAGRSVGVALQIADDVRRLASALGEDGAPSDDVMNKRKLYPVARAFEIALPSERRRLGDFYFKRVLEPADARALANLVNEIGGGADARSRVDGLLAQARERLSGALDDARLDRLGSLAHELVG